MFYIVNITNRERVSMYNEFRQENRNHPKVFFEQYLYNLSDPRDDSSYNTPPELEAELLENSLVMKRRYRHIAQRLRKRYI